MNRNTPLTADEKEQLLWHGVRSSDPYLIYNSDKEGFDGTYANVFNLLIPVRYVGIRSVFFYKSGLLCLI
jgi:hypothetical protein